MSVLEVEGLNLFYGDRQVLFDVSFGVERGEVLCIVGESGSGKSSILYSILGLLPQTARLEGRILFEGRDLTELEESAKRSIRGRSIGMIFQEPSSYLDPLFTAGYQVEEVLRAHRATDDYRDGAISSMARAGIPLPEEKYSMYPHQLSGGLKQRVCIATAIACDPVLLLADEPTTALDVSVQKRILQLFRSFRREGKSVILVTHDFGVVAEVADRVAVLKDGRVVEEGEVYEIFDSPKEVYTRRLLESF